MVLVFSRSVKSNSLRPHGLQPILYPSVVLPPVLGQALIAPLWVRMVLPHLDIVLLCFEAAKYKGLEDPRLGVIDVSGYFGLAGICVWRLQAEVRPQGCKGGSISVK